ncbi:MAG: LexA family transcriptional regulator [Streptococcus salivarius]|jgi:repressor LexA|uniref:helix-turn-helix domain-containing protein n=1 Tax=Streptococcus salivarius TaxID=1304 RepID=UPI000A092047|nr:LexA family transcriptional regulator [Streptococcus salivarius]ARI60675.1 repressor [Streptococcus salivarius]MDU2713204.1 LexA family transcriptional regulator [Streptococcus salivarius]
MKECKDSNNLMGEMFTDRLIKLRQARGWTKKEFSAKIGKTQQTVGKWENGSNAPTFKDLVKLVGLFGVTSDYLLGLSDSPSKYAYPPINDNKQEQVEEMFKELDEGNQDATVDFIENRLDNQHISKEIKENDHRKQIVKQDQRPTKRVSIYAKVDAQGFEVSEVPVDCLDYPVPIPVHDIAFKVVGDSLEPSFFDDEVMFVMKDSILRTGDICIVQLKSKYHVMKVSQNIDNGDILLNSLNSNEAPITLSEKDDFSIFGKIVLM